MNKILTFAIGAMMIGAIASCNQGPAPIVGAELDKKIDSTKQALMVKAQEDISKNCEERKKTEVMAKADSIVTAEKEAKHI
ncbi:MAG: hypothetical protein RJA07_2201 [Bacteroidota bacterium]|jgi:hypothetical protein